MKLSAREMTLGLATVGVLVVAGTWLWSEARFESLAELRQQRERQGQIVERARQLLAREDEWRERLAVIHERLPRYGTEERVSAALMQMMESKASDANLTLLRSTPERERKVGELYEISINYRWEGELESLVAYLYAMQTESMNLDFRQLSISPSSDRGQGLKLQGNFIVDIAYTRSDEVPAADNPTSETTQTATRGLQ